VKKNTTVIDSTSTCITRKILKHLIFAIPCVCVVDDDDDDDDNNALKGAMNFYFSDKDDYSNKWPRCFALRQSDVLHHRRHCRNRRFCKNFKACTRTQIIQKHEKWHECGTARQQCSCRLSDAAFAISAQPPKFCDCRNIETGKLSTQQPAHLSLCWQNGDRIMEVLILHIGWN